MTPPLKYEYPGTFIVIDGPNGVGKSTVINRIMTDLANDLPDYECIKISEPTKTSIGQSIREFSEKESHNNTLLNLVAADREFNHVEYIRPLLKKTNVILISDRYFTSSLVYQRMHGLEVNTILEIHKNIYIPDILIILEGDTDKIKERLQLERSSKQLFENPDNVEIEIAYFNDALEVLKGYKYNTRKVFNGVLDETVGIIKTEILNIVKNKSKK